MSAAATIANANIKISASSEDLKAAVDDAIGQIQSFAIKAASAFGILEAAKHGAAMARQADIGKVAMDRLTGSVETTKELTERLKGIYSGTLFESSSIKQAAQQMLRYGFSAQEIPDILRSVADAAALSGSGMDEAVQSMVHALGRVRNEGHVTARDMRRFVEEGVDAYRYLAEQITKETGVVTSKNEAMNLVEKGQVSPETALQGITAGIANDPKAAGAAKAMGDSVSGAMMEIQRNVEHVSKGIFVALNQALDIKGIAKDLAGVSDRLEKMADGAASIATAFAPLRLAVATVWEFVKALAETFGALAEGILGLGSGWMDFAQQAQGALQNVGQLRDAFLNAFNVIASAAVQAGVMIADGFEVAFQAAANVVENVVATILAAANELGIVADATVQKWEAAAETSRQRIAFLVNGGIGKEMQEAGAKVDAFFDKLRGAGKGEAGGGAAQAVKKVADAVGGLNTHVERYMDYLQQAHDHWQALSDEIAGDGVSALQKYQERVQEIGDAFLEGGLSGKEFEKGLGQAFQKLRAAMPEQQHGGYTEAVLQGTVEAQRLQYQSPMKTVEDILREAKKVQDAQEQDLQNILAALKSGNAVLVPVN